MRAIGAFVVLTFAVTWTLWAIVLRVTDGDPSRAPPLLAVGGLVFLIGVFTPGLVALAFTAREDGRRGVATLLGRIAHWRIDARFYAFALLLIPLLKLTAAVVNRGVTGTWPRFGDTHPALLVVATILSTIGQAGEEIGWRGFLLPRLTARTGLVVASFIIGVIWATWHLPLFFAPGADTQGQSFPLFALQVTAYSVVLAWLYWRTGGSLLVTMLAHAAFNNLKDIVPSGGVPGANPFTLDATLMSRISVLLLWGVAAFLLIRMRGVRRVGETFPA